MGFRKFVILALISPLLPLNWFENPAELVLGLSYAGVRAVTCFCVVQSQLERRPQSVGELWVVFCKLFL